MNNKNCVPNGAVPLLILIVFSRQDGDEVNVGEEWSSRGDDWKSSKVGLCWSFVIISSSKAGGWTNFGVTWISETEFLQKTEVTSGHIVFCTLLIKSKKWNK